MRNEKLNILIGGPAGAGIEKSGQSLTLSFVRGGYHVFANVEHMSQIRGGNNFLRIRVDDNLHECHAERIDIMIALDKQTILDHLEEMNEGGAIIFDGEAIGITEEEIGKMEDEEKAGQKTLPGQKKIPPRGEISFINLPLKKLAAEKLGMAIMENTIALGVVMGLIGLDLKILEEVLAKIFAKKDAAIIEMNKKAVQMGFELAGKWSKDFPYKMAANPPLQKMFLMGNDALAMGAVKAGVKYIGEYPMTPSSSILHFMANWAAKYGIVVKHVEDEIAAINSVIGAGFTGARAMCATSGGGFALMTEAVGLASMNEVPIVVINVMRPGPATGQPTRTEAGDLRQVIHSGQGDPVKIVLLPGDPNECFEMAFLAFNLAEKYQLPVIVCYDKALGEGYYTIAPFSEKNLEIERGKILNEKELAKFAADGISENRYKRYLFTDDGVSPRAIPGQKNGMHRATSDEHNEFGEIEEASLNRQKMVEKRMKKLEVAMKELPQPELIGDKNADATFVTWASTKGACKEAAELLKKEGVKVNVLQIKTAWPFLKSEVSEILKKCKKPILVEQNYTAQMGGLIAESTGILIEEKILRYDGRPMTADFIINQFNNLKV